VEKEREMSERRYSEEEIDEFATRMYEGGFLQTAAIIRQVKAELASLGAKNEILEGELKVKCSGCNYTEAFTELREVREAAHNLLGYFRSGNDIPVERATIKTDCKEVQELKAVTTEGGTP
jgi:hypothetical protein